MPEADFQPDFAHRSADLKASFIREILKVTTRKDVISFAGGLPNPAFFPVDAVNEATQKVLKESGQSALQYTVTEGFLPLKEQIAQRYSEKQGLSISPEEILITNGSQQGLDLVGKMMIDAGDRVLLEDPSFIGAIQSFRIFEPEFKTVSLEKDGMNISELESASAEKKPKLCYTVPNFHNPTGFTYSEEKRRTIGQFMAEKGILLLEDDPYGEINFTREQPTSFAHHHPKGTLLMGSFSKTIAPGLRMGWITAPKAIMEKLVVIKQAADTHSNHLAQRTIHQFLTDNNLDSHISTITAAYHKQCKTMLQAMETHFPKEVVWHAPKGGMFIWCELPRQFSATALFQKAIEEKVAFVPARAFYAAENVDHTFRMNFSNADPALIEEGISRLGKCLKEMVRT